MFALNCTIGSHLISLNFAIDFANFVAWLHTPPNGRMDQWTDRPTDGWTNGRTMFISRTVVIDASESDDLPTDFVFLAKQLLTVQRTDLPMD